MILEVHLHNFIAKSKHNSMLGPHPFLDVNTARWILQLIGLIQFVPLNKLFFLLRIIVLFQIRLEMLEKCHLLLEILREISEAVLRHDVLLFVGSDGFSLIIVELSSTGLSYDLCGIIEEHTSRHIGQQIAQTVFGRIINPFGHPDLSSLVDRCLVLSRSLWPLHLSFVIYLDRLLTNILTSRGTFLAKSLHIL